MYGENVERVIFCRSVLWVCQISSTVGRDIQETNFLPRRWYCGGGFMNKSSSRQDGELAYREKL